MAEQVVRVGMPLADFIEQYHKQPFELVRGEMVTLSPNIVGHQWTAQILYDLLRDYVRPKTLGVVAFETPFVLTHDSDWVKGSRTPDLAFYRAERWTAYTTATPDWKEKPYILVPDLAVEVVSPNDRYTDIQDKVDGYLADGVQVAWVIDPQRRKIAIHVAGSDQQTTLSENDTLTGGELLPEFSIAIKSLFE